MNLYRNNDFGEVTFWHYLNVLLATISRASALCGRAKSDRIAAAQAPAVADDSKQAQGSNSDHSSYELTGIDVVVLIFPLRMYGPTGKDSKNERITLLAVLFFLHIYD